MPIYDYVCSNGHVTEVIHGVHAASPSVCPVCGAPVRKAMSAPAVHFKGSGWAKKERSTKPSPAKSDSDSPKAGASDGAKADRAKADGAKADGGRSTETAKPATGTNSEAQ